MKRMTDERLAEIEAVYTWQVDCGDLHITFQEMAEELLQAMKAERACSESWKKAVEESETQFRMLYRAFKAEIQDCRDAWVPDQPPSDLSQFLTDLESVLK